VLNCVSFNTLIWCFPKLENWKRYWVLHLLFHNVTMKMLLDVDVRLVQHSHLLLHKFMVKCYWVLMYWCSNFPLPFLFEWVVGWGWSAFEKSSINAWKLLWDYNIISIIIISDIITSLLWFWIFYNIILRCFQCYLQTQKHKEYRQKISSHYQVCSNQIYIFIPLFLDAFVCLYYNSRLETCIEKT